MRAARKRVVRRKQVQTIRRKSTGDNGAESWYMNSPDGRMAQREALGVQRGKQSSLCAECGEFIPLADAKFQYRRCPDGVENKVVHKGVCVGVGVVASESESL